MNQTLYNCCPGFECPPAAELLGYETFYIAPCAIVPGEGGEGECIEALGEDEAYRADFWTVYGRLPGGEACALTDCSTRKLAIYASANFHWERTRARLQLAKGLAPRGRDARRAMLFRVLQDAIEAHKGASWQDAATTWARSHAGRQAARTAWLASSRSVGILSDYLLGQD